MWEGPDQTVHPCNLIGAVINHFMTIVTNKIVLHRNCSFAFRVLVSFKMSFEILMISIYVVCRRVASCRLTTAFSLYIWIIVSIRLRHLDGDLRGRDEIPTLSFEHDIVK